MKITSTYATQNQFKWLKEKDRDINVATLKKKVLDKEIIIAQSENEILGWLRFWFFWDKIPFINMLFIEEAHCNKGIGRKLVEFWETEMNHKKYKMVMTSSQSEVEAQQFYRKLGYVDAGSLTFPKKPMELIFIKKI